MGAPTADGAGNGEGPEAALMRTLLDTFAAYERALIRARTRAAHLLVITPLRRSLHASA